MKVIIELEVTAEQRKAIGNALLTWKPAPEEGVRFWALETLTRELKALEAGPGVQPAGYRPYHAPDCPARDAAASTDRCMCGGLKLPVWKPGDEPKEPSTVGEGAPEVAAGE